MVMFEGFAIHLVRNKTNVSSDFIPYFGDWTLIRQVKKIGNGLKNGTGSLSRRKINEVKVL
jgi:hypothetical protein